MKQDESSVQKISSDQKTVLEKVLDVEDSSKSQSQSPANQSAQSQPKIKNEPKTEPLKFRKNKTPKKSRKTLDEKSFESITSKCFHCDKESTKDIPLQRCSACNRKRFEIEKCMILMHILCSSFVILKSTCTSVQWDWLS